MSKFQFKSIDSNSRRLFQAQYICIYFVCVCVQSFRWNTSAPDIKAVECTCEGMPMMYTIWTMCTASTWIQSNIFASIVQFNRKAKQQFKNPLSPLCFISVGTIYKLQLLRARLFLAHSELLLTFSFQPWISNEKNRHTK